VEYRNVQKEPGSIKEMLEFSGGHRDVPVIVENGRVTIGYGGS
jgi:glutaredoxin